MTNVVSNCRDRLEKRGDICRIVAPSYGAKADAEGEAGYCEGVFHNRSLAVPFLGFRNSTPKSDKKLKKMLDELRPDILHAHSPFAICSYFFRYGRRHGIPVVYTFHTKFRDEFLRFTRSRLITAVMMKIIMRNINRLEYVWAVSVSAAQTLRSYGYRGDIKVMRNGTDMSVASYQECAALSAEIEKEYGISRDERIFLYAGRVVSVKNIKFSLKVIAELKRRGFKCRFFVVGGGEELEAHKKFAAKLGISDITVFTDFVCDRRKLSAFYARANLVLFPSTFDTFGLVIQEAAAFHTPSFVPEGSSAAEIITDGVNGYTEKLDVTAWADKTERIFSGGFGDVCDGCIELVYTWESAVRDAAAEYERVIADYNSRKNNG